MQYIKENKKRFCIAAEKAATKKRLLPKIWTSWIANPCLSYAQRKYRKERKTAVIAPFDKDTHTLESQKVAKLLEEKGFEVKQELPLFDTYKCYEIGHFYDIIAFSEDDVVVVVEVKPTDKECYAKQYTIAAEILDRNFDSFKYYVYEYLTGQFIPKTFPDFSAVRKEMNERVQIILDDVDAEPVPTRYCGFCPFAKCVKHPRHDSLCEIDFEVGS